LKIKDYDLKNSGSKKEYNEKLFDIVAPRYDAVTRVLSFGRDRSWKKMMIGMLPSLENPVCLDIACGTGDISLLLLKKYGRADVTGLDLNGEMLSIAGKRTADSGGLLRFEIGDMSDIRKNGGTYDIVTGGYALRNAPDIGRTVAEIFRITKTGGTCAFLDFSKSGNKFIRAVQLFFLKFWGSVWGILFHGNPEIYGYIADSLKLYPDRKTLKGLLEKNGFRDIGSKLLFFGFIEILIFRK
jgi:ubiquinone/menaquinone biosynthesis methyltransferase